MSTVPITISVSADVAEAFLKTAPEHRREIELLLGLRLRELTLGTDKSLQKIMDEIGTSAIGKGLTEDRLTKLFDGK